MSQGNFKVYAAVGMDLVDLIQALGITDMAKKHKHMYITDGFETEKEAQIFCNGIDLMSQLIHDPVECYIEDNSPKPATEEIEGDKELSDDEYEQLYYKQAGWPSYKAKQTPGDEEFDGYALGCGC